MVPRAQPLPAWLPPWYSIRLQTPSSGSNSKTLALQLPAGLLRTSPAALLQACKAHAQAPNPPPPPPHRFATRVAWLCTFLAHVDPTARAAAAKLVGVASAALQPEGATRHVVCCALLCA